MKTKALEIRDKGTFIPALAVEMSGENEGQRYLLERSGYSSDRPPLIALTVLRTKGDRITYDPYDWTGSRTWKVAHLHIIREWNRLSDGDVIDVQFILGETEAPKVSERLSEI